MNTNNDIIKILQVDNVLIERMIALKHNNWLPDTHADAFSSLYSYFYQHQTEHPLACYDALDGWECGLYQILDIGREDICRILPVLLTAYCYNYARGIKFVQGFLKKGIPASWKSPVPSKPNPYYTGIKQDIDDILVEEGIGKLLCGAEINHQELKNYSKQFSFPELKIVPLSSKPSYAPPIFPEVYIIPIKGESVFRRNVHFVKEPLRDAETNRQIEKEVYKGNRFEFTISDFKRLGLTWMLVVYTVASENIKSAQRRNQKPDFACEPDLRACDRYLMSVMENASAIRNENIPETYDDRLNEKERNVAFAEDLRKLFQQNRT